MKAQVFDDPSRKRKRSCVVRDVLEPDVLRGTRPVLRGGNVSNGVLLPDGACSAKTIGIMN